MFLTVKFHKQNPGYRATCRSVGAFQLRNVAPHPEYAFLKPWPYSETISQSPVSYDACTRRSCAPTRGFDRCLVLQSTVEELDKFGQRDDMLNFFNADNGLTADNDGLGSRDFRLVRSALPVSFHRSGVSRRSKVIRPRRHPLRTGTD